MSFHEHGLVLYLSPELYLALVKLQADRTLGRCYAGLSALIEGFYRLGYLSKEDYEELSKRYNKPLIRKKEPTSAQLKEHEEIERLEKHFLNVSRQWPQLSNRVRNGHVRNARLWVGKVKNANLILQLESESEVTS